MLDRLRLALPDQVQLNLNESKTLMLSKQLPFNPRTSTPDIYTSFRKKVEGLGITLDGGLFTEPLKTATWGQGGRDIQVSVGKEKAGLKPYPELGDLNAGEKTGGWVTKGDELDSIQGMYAKLVGPLLASPPIGGWSAATKGTSLPSIHKSSAIPFAGGEGDALARLEDYVGHGTSDGFWQGGSKAKSYKDTRNGLIGEAFSTKFSALFSLGTLSPREAGWRVGGLLETVNSHDKHTWNNVYCESARHR